jgi:hypothetical protein
MALTLEKDQKLGAVGLIEFFNEGRPIWLELAKKSYDFFDGNLPGDSKVRPDDVAKVLEPMVEVNKELRAFLNKKKLKQNYWIPYFTDLVIDSTWDVISEGEANADKTK